MWWKGERFRLLVYGNERCGGGVKELRQITDGVRRSWALVLVVFMLAVTPLGALAVVRAGAQTDTAQGSPISSGPTIGPIG